MVMAMETTLQASLFKKTHKQPTNISKYFFRVLYLIFPNMWQSLCSLKN